MKEIILLVTMQIVTICTYVSYIPQIVKLIRTKSAEDLSVASWILWTLRSLSNAVYSIILSRSELIIASVSELLLIVVVLMLSIKYQKKKDFRTESDNEFNKRLERIQSKDGNHMLLTTSMIIEREKYKEYTNNKRVKGKL